jgi:hypothetical protein
MPYPKCPECGSNENVVRVDNGEPYGYPYEEKEYLCLACVGEYFYDD